MGNVVWQCLALTLSLPSSDFWPWVLLTPILLQNALWIVLEINTVTLKGLVCLAVAVAQRRGPWGNCTVPRSQQFQNNRLIVSWIFMSSHFSLADFYPDCLWHSQPLDPFVLFFFFFLLFLSAGGTGRWRSWERRSYTDVWANGVLPHHWLKEDQRGSSDVTATIMAKALKLFTELHFMRQFAIVICRPARRPEWVTKDRERGLSLSALPFSGLPCHPAIKINVHFIWL